jgi:hypothetical protein
MDWREASQDQTRVVWMYPILTPAEIPAEKPQNKAHYPCFVLIPDKD